MMHLNQKLILILMKYTAKIPGSVKKWKVPGIKSITTVKQKKLKKSYEEVMKTTVVNFNNTVLNDYFINTSIRVVEMTAGGWGWNWSKRNIISLEIKKVRVVNMMYNKTAFYFVPLRFSRQEWSVAPSIFNIKARRLAHCLLWVKLS